MGDVHVEFLEACRIFVPSHGATSLVITVCPSCLAGLSLCFCSLGFFALFWGESGM